MNNIQLIHGDCLVEMQNIPDKSVDMILCDLPYGVLHKNNPHAQWDRVLPFDKIWEQYKRIIKDNGAIVLFAQGMFTAQLMMSSPKMWRYNLIWDKQRVTGFLNANRMPLRCHEDICVFYKSLPTYNPQYIDGQPNHARGNGKHKETNNLYGKYKANYNGRAYESVPRVASTVPQGKKLPRSIISIKKEHESKVYHPTQKAVALLEYLIKTYSNDGDTILDNTMGSGSTGVACVNTKRNFIGIELDEKYFKIAEKRIKEAQQEYTQLNLF
jgi:site-specific DNA-methyltransferase (adenine-specific)